MTSAKATQSKDDNSKKINNGNSSQANLASPSGHTGSRRGENKVPYEAENIEHTIRRAMREKERKRIKNPGLYL